MDAVSLCAQDREILAVWAELGGVPDDQGTRDVACRMLLKLWAAHQELDAALGEVLAMHAGEAALLCQLAKARREYARPGLPHEDLLRHEAEVMDNIAAVLDDPALHQPLRALPQHHHEANIRLLRGGGQR